MKVNLTREDVSNMLTEADRRLNISIRELVEAGEVVTEREIRDLKATIMDGVYGTAMVISSNWPETVYMFDQEEEKMNFWGV